MMSEFDEIRAGLEDAVEVARGKRQAARRSVVEVPTVDVGALRRRLQMSQAEFARTFGVSVGTVRNWEQGRRRPEGPAIALLRIAARHPRIIRENLKSAA